MSDHPGPARAFGWLSLAATPVFAVMALLTAAQDEGPGALLCGAGASDDLFLAGMVLMNALMNVLHAAPRLRLIESRWQRRTTM
jgi:hypothetical protein